MNKKIRWCTIAGILALVLLGAIVWHGTGKQKEETETADNTEETLPEELEEYMTINLFSGFSGESAKEVVDGSLSNSEVLFEYAGSYDGVFYEDGKNEEKKQIFSVIITNVAAETLEVMQLWIEDENGESYQFQVSALPSGGTVLAQELSGKQFRTDGVYTIVRDSFGFLEDEQTLVAIDVQESEGKIYVTNQSPATVSAVQIIYKNWLGNHAYLGGIAYRIPLEQIAAGETLQVTAEHYQDGASKVTGMKQSLEPVGGVDEEFTN